MSKFYFPACLQAIRPFVKWGIIAIYFATAILAIAVLFWQVYGETVKGLQLWD